ncbi:hypothetical protein DYU11_17215 [Fibrisoma montanum]|uniref:Outer membrane protein beta-barrel domain-containing protein n=1 Tax=Fibrisoma montanum TaxID=2305895 RepID=A0A418M5H5_9BACT|nr:outer membrane beta-barrel protein [Fibrisoma montanum]RIV21167.1 hypothetical protein DYU11_17215 [Fibrisoma montanum]
MKHVLLSLFMLAAVSATAQEFKPFKFNISLGYAKPSGPGASGGVLYSLEPKYGISDNIDLGLRIEGALMIRGVVVNGEDAEGELKASASYLATGTYLLTTTNFRPYIGAGVGLYSVASTGVTVIDDETEAGTLTGGTKFGGMVRAGFKAGHFNLGLEYNLIPATEGIIMSNNGFNTNVSSKNSYFGIKLGVDIGGGRYK